MSPTATFVRLMQLAAIVYYLFVVVNVESVITVPTSLKLNLIEYTSDILCSFQPKVVHVYFENETSLGYRGQILRELNDCGISYISIKNKTKFTSRPHLIFDDGILMYLVIIIRDALHPIQPRMLLKRSAAKHLSYVMMVIEDSEAITNAWLRITFRNFWQIWLLNVVIMFWRNNQLQVYRYDPFMDAYLVKVNYAGSLPTFKELFPKKMPNMQGKPLRMCMYLDKIRATYGKNKKIMGSDGLMSSFIAESFNATRIINRNSMYADPNKNTELCFREIQRDMDDIAINIRFLAPSSFARRVESTIVHTRDDLCVLVPRAKKATIFWNLFRSFRPVVWMLILFSVPIAYSFCELLYRRINFSSIDLMQIIAGLLTMPFTRIPLKSCVRLFILFWLFYGMLICSSFKGNLTSNLVFRRNLPDINTMQDLSESPYDLLVYSRYTRHLIDFLNISQPFEAVVKRKITVVPDVVVMQHIQNNNISYAYLEKFHVAHFYAGERRHVYIGYPIYHVMATCLVPFHAVYIVPYGSPYLGFINTLIRSSHEFGFITYWENLMNAEFRNSRRFPGRRNNSDATVLRLAHFQAAFGLLILGLSIAFCRFIWEVFHENDVKLFFAEFRRRLNQN